MIGNRTMRENLEDLIRRAKAGDRRAFDRLIEAHRKRLESLICSRRKVHGARSLEPEDLLQETLLRAFESIGRFSWQGEDSFMRWLGGIVEKVILHFRRQGLQRQAAPLEREIEGAGISPSRLMRRHERFDRLEEALKSLSPDHREVIVLARIEGLKTQEIARRMNRSPNAVMQLLWRALEQFKAAFGETESLHLPERRLGKEPEGRHE
ncbi:MAG: sigma-70 family RNA polymerase sigma factor [Planctomycetes bacterium]|nr:sigma-70 family RNA polymerase sigma factor [Planctomycetota bacterium]